MAQNEVVGLSAEMKVQQALDELKRLGPGADKEAKAIAASLGKALKDSEKAAKKLGEEMAKAGKGGGASIDAAGKAAVKLRGALSSLSPTAGAVAGAVDDAADAIEAMEIGAAAAGISLAAAGAAVAVVTVVLAAGALAYVAYNDEQAKAAEVAGLVAAAEAKLAPLIDATRLAQLDAAVATGAMTEAAGKLEREGIASLAAFAAATGDTQKQIRALTDSQTSFTGQVSHGFADLVEYAQGFTVVQVASLGTVNALAAMTESTSETDAKIAALSGVVEHGVQVTRDLRTAHVETASATRHHADASRDLSSAIKAEAEAEKLRRDAFIAAAEAYNDADALVAKSGEFRLTEIEKITRAEEDAVAAYLDLAHASQTSDLQIAADTATIRGNYEEQITAKRAEETAEREATAKESAERLAAAEAAATARTVGMITDSAQVAASVLTSLGDSAEATYSHALDMADRLTGQLAAGEEFYTDAQKQALQKRIAAQRDAAHKAFAAQKAAGVATATVQLFVAEAQAIASAPWPYNVPAIAEATIAGGAAVAGAASVQEPTFHRGYAPDEQPATILRKEAVMTTTAANAMGPKQIERLNDGATRGGYQGPAPVVLGHRVVNDLIKRELSTAGALTVAMNGDRIVGHRTNRRGVTG